MSRARPLFTKLRGNITPVSSALTSQEKVLLFARGRLTVNKSPIETGNISSGVSYANDRESFENELANVPIAAVVPAYRVAQQIGRVIGNMPFYVRNIIVVDDCSSDDTALAVERCESPRVRLVRHQVNQGVGGAMLTGYAAALQLGAEIVIKMDGDDQMDPQCLPILLMPIIKGDADYTKGNRFLHRYELVQMPFVRRIGNFALTFLTKLATGYWNIFDPNNGYTAIHSNVLRLINVDLIHRRYFFETSMLFALRRVQAVVLDVPIPARYGDEVSSLSLRRVLISFPCNLIQGLFHRLGWQYFLYDFTAVSLLLVLSLPLLIFGVVWGGWNWYISVTQGIIATTGTVLLSVLPIILSIQFLIQALSLDIGSIPQKVLHRRIARSNELLTHRSSLATYRGDREISGDV
jgi:glycosyltransferase involved in cell wall biosynthesis